MNRLKLGLFTLALCLIGLNVKAQDPSDEDCDTGLYLVTNAVTDKGADYAPFIKFPGDHGIFFFNLFGKNTKFFFDDAFLFTLNEDGILQGTGFFEESPFTEEVGNCQWEMTFILEKFDEGIAKIETKGDFQTSVEDGWEYWIVTSGTGTALDENGEPKDDAKRFEFGPVMGGDGPYQVQIGQNANGKNDRFGASSWFDWTLLNADGSPCGEGQGDFNVDLECIGRILPEFCPSPITPLQAQVLEENGQKDAQIGDVMFNIRNAATVTDLDKSKAKFPSIAPNAHGIYLFNFKGKEPLRLLFKDGATLTDRITGEIIIQGEAESLCDEYFDKTFEICLTLDEFPEGVAKNETKLSGQELADVIAGWDLYKVTQGTIICKENGVETGQIMIMANESSPYQAQLGYCAANGKNDNLGLSSWFHYKENITNDGGAFGPIKKGDINIDILCPLINRPKIEAEVIEKCIDPNGGRIILEILNGTPEYFISYREVGSDEEVMVETTSDTEVIIANLPIGEYIIKISDKAGTIQTFTEEISQDLPSCVLGDEPDDEPEVVSIFGDFCNEGSEDDDTIQDEDELVLFIENAVTLTDEDFQKVRFPSVAPRSHGIYLFNFFEGSDTSLLGGKDLRLNFSINPVPTLTVKDDGSVLIEGEMISVDFGDKRFEASITLERCEDCEFKNELKSQSEFDLLSADWEAYKIVEGTISCPDFGDIQIKADDDIEQAQVGFGANGKNCNFGLSSWFKYKHNINRQNGYSSYKKGDINIDIVCPLVRGISGFSASAETVCVQDDIYEIGKVIIFIGDEGTPDFSVFYSNTDKSIEENFQTSDNLIEVCDLPFDTYEFVIIDKNGAAGSFTDTIDELDPPCDPAPAPPICYDYSLNLCKETSFTDLTDLATFISNLGQAGNTNGQAVNHPMVPDPDNSTLEICDDGTAKLTADVEFCGRNWCLTVCFEHDDFEEFESNDEFADDGRSINRLVCKDCPENGVDMNVYLTDVELEVCHDPMLNIGKMTFNWNAPQLAQYAGSFPTFGTAGICTKLKPLFDPIVEEECTNAMSDNGVLLESIDPILKTAIFDGNTQKCLVDPLSAIYVVSQSQQIQATICDKDFTFDLGNMSGCSIPDAEICQWDMMNPTSTGTTQLSVFPNPNKGIFKLNAIGQEGLIEVMNTEGKVIYESFFNSYLDEELDLSEYGNGMYIIRTTTPDGQTKVTRMLLSK
ncbi:T9SS type A sorting domain-containing protein [Sediminitomix flava]|nr:T9SS type A sorting domain-containing protein [Sediminitomix flava]